jgi:hypothetical protein
MNQVELGTEKELGITKEILEQNFYRRVYEV